MLRPSAFLVAAVALTATLAAAQPPADLVVRDVTLIDGRGAPPRAHVDLIVRDGRIAAIEPGAQTPPDADLVVNGAGLFAIPGLFDAHVHLSPSPWDERAVELHQVLAGGVTSVYDVAGDVRETSDFARAVAAREIDGPSIDYCALMAGPAFFSDPRVVASSLGYRPGDAPWMRAVTPETDMVRAVAEARGSGATAIKLYAALDAAAVRRIADEAHRQGVRLVAHATVFPARPGDLVEAGVTMLAHAAYLVWEGSPVSADFTKRALGDFEHVKPDSPPIEHLLESMKARGVALNPTLWIFAEGPSSHDPEAPARRAWQSAVTRRAAELGVTIVAGTDALLDRGSGLPTLHDELRLLVADAGLTPMQAIESATFNAAKTIGVDRDRGSLEPGKAADMVLLAANPLDDIRNTTKIRHVLKDGRLVK